MKKKTMRALCAALILILCMTSAGFAAPSAPADPIKLIRIALKNEESTLTPHTYSTEDGYNLLKLIYEPLYTLDENLNPIPWLATGYTVSGDGLTYRFTIHEGVTFHDGQPLTAEDVKFTYDYLLANPTAKTRFSGPASVISEINVVDALTVEMKLSQQAPEFMNKPISEMGILPKHIWENVEDATTATIEHAIGSGAYKLVEIKAGEYYKLEKYSDYYLKGAVADQLYLPVIKDDTARNTALKSGEIDATIRELPPELISDFQSNAKLKTIEGKGFVSTMMYFNCERYPFDLQEFRTALAYATDSKEIVDIVMLGAATEGSLGYVHPSLSSYNPNVNVIPFDIAKANEILDGLHFVDTNGNGIRETDKGDELSFEILVGSNVPQRMRIAEFVKDWYQQIGVSLTIKALDRDVLDELVWPDFNAANGREFDLVMWGWGASTMNSVQRLYEMMYSDLTKGNSNIGAYQNAGLDAVFDQLLSETDEAKRVELIKKIQEIYSADFGAITFYYADIVYAYNPEVYDNWTMMQGTGIVNNLSLVDRTENFDQGVSAGEAENTPATDQGGAPGSQKSSSPITWIIAVIIVATIALIVILTMRSKKNK